MARGNSPLKDEEKKFMAANGLVQWLAASVKQGQRLRDIFEREFREFVSKSPAERLELILRSRTEATYLVSAAKHVIEYKKWATGMGLFSNVDFTRLDAFSLRNIIDLRNMREHEIDYFEGAGNAQQRWFIETPEYKADASAVVGSQIGGRLDYQAFSSACEITLQDVIVHPDVTGLDSE